MSKNSFLVSMFFITVSEQKNCLFSIPLQVFLLWIGHEEHSNQKLFLDILTNSSIDISNWIHESQQRPKNMKITKVVEGLGTIL